MLRVLELSVLPRLDSLGLGGGGGVVTDPERARGGPNTVSGSEGVSLEGLSELLDGDETRLGVEGGQEVPQHHHVVEALNHFGWRPDGLSPMSSSGQ